MIRLINIAFIFWFLPFLSEAQDVQTEIEAITSFYSNTASFEYSIKMFVYDEISSTNPEDSIVIEMRQNKKDYLMKMAFIEILNTKNMNLYIDHSVEKIYVLENNVVGEKLGLAQLQNIAEEYGLSNVQYKSIDDKTGAIQFSSLVDKNSIIELTYDKEKYFLKSTKVIVDQSFNGYSIIGGTKKVAVYTEPNFNKKDNSISPGLYVVQNRNGLVPSEDFSNYEIKSN